MFNDDFDFNLEEEEGGGLSLPVGTTVRVTVPQGAPPFQYVPGARGVLPPGSSFVGLIEGFTPSPTEERPQQASGSSQRTRQQNAPAREGNGDLYKIAALGDESKLRENGEALNSSSLAVLALASLRHLAVPGSWVVEAHIPNAPQRLKGAQERLQAAKSLHASAYAGASQGRQLLEALPTAKRAKEGEAERGDAESEGTLLSAPTRSHKSIPPMFPAGNVDEFGIVPRGGDELRPSHLVVLQADPLVTAELSSPEARARVCEDAGIPSLAVKTK